MRRIMLASFLLPLLGFTATVHAQQPPETDDVYLQNRAAALNDRIDLALRDRKLSKRQAAKLHLSVRRVQTTTGHLTATNGSVSRADADRMNQQLTDVERTLTGQR